MLAFNAGKTVPTFQLPSTWWEWSLWVLAGLASIFLVRLTVSLDLNLLMKSRRELKIARLQNACPHMLIDYLGEGNFRITSCFQSPPGTTLYFCNRCQRTSWNPNIEFDGAAEYYTANPTEYANAEKRFSRLLKKYRYSA
jgi:hypothetical protein